MSRANLTAVISAYNEAATIVEVCRRTRAHLDHVVVVNDASSDRTPELLEAEDVTVLHHARNRGKAGALWTGMQHAVRNRASGVITLDGDGQHAPEHIPRLIQAARDNPGCMVIASRVRAARNAPRLRRFANRCADRWIGWACGVALCDSQSGFRCYPASLIRVLNIPHGTRRGFVFESEVLIEAAWLGVPIVAMPVESIYPPGMRRSYYHPVRDTFRIAGMVAGRLSRRGLYPRGLLRSLTGRVRWYDPPCDASPS